MNETNLRAEVASLRDLITSLEKRLAKLEELVPRTMTTDDLWQAQREAAEKAKPLAGS